MRENNDLGIFDFDDFTMEMTSNELLLVNGGVCGGGVDCFGSVLWAINQEGNSVPDQTATGSPENDRNNLGVLEMINTELHSTGVYGRLTFGY